MKPLPITPEILRVARRVVWFEEPETTLADPVRFLAHVMVLGTIEDLAALHSMACEDDYREALAHPPPGLFDPRSWAYWNIVFGRYPAPPLPRRAGLEEAKR